MTLQKYLKLPHRKDDTPEVEKLVNDYNNLADELENKTDSQGNSLNDKQLKEKMEEREPLLDEIRTQREIIKRTIKRRGAKDIDFE